jgi:hypothetical protein
LWCARYVTVNSEAPATIRQTRLVVSDVDVPGRPLTSVPSAPVTALHGSGRRIATFVPGHHGWFHGGGPESSSGRPSTTTSTQIAYRTAYCHHGIGVSRRPRAIRAPPSWSNPRSRTSARPSLSERTASRTPSARTFGGSAITKGRIGASGRGARRPIRPDGTTLSTCCRPT